MYGEDVLTGDWRRRRAVPEVDAERDLVVEDVDSGFCGAVVGFELGAVVLEDRHGKRRNFPLSPAAFLLDGAVVTLRKPVAGPAPAARRVTASGSVAVDGVQARVAKASRIWVEGIHDAALIERIWGDDLRIEGVVVEPLDGVDELAAAVRDFRPGRTRRLGVLVDHLVPGSKESRIVAAVDHPWKEGICAAVGVREPADMWRRILASVSSYKDVETPLINSMERLIDFVTEPA
jgi:hypothetical protein